MSKGWDNTGITFQPETWATLADILHPGAFLFVFAGSRGWHRLACAMEDANLILQPTIFIWLNSQAFPKASRIRKAPKPARERRYRWLGWLGRLGNWLLRKGGKPPGYYLDFVWEGHRYGGQILKDCASPIIVAQKPWTNPRLDCIVRTGAGSLNVDAGRIKANDFEPKDRVGAAKLMEDRPWQERQMREGRPRITEGNNLGRWPSNFALVHTSPQICPHCGGDGSSKTTAMGSCDFCDDKGTIGGCVRAGTRRVKSEPRRKSPKRHNRSNEAEGNEHVAYGQFGDCVTTGYADPDGFERVTDWRCAEGCPAFRLGEQSGESKSVRSMRGDLVDNRGDNYGRAEGKRIPNSNYMRGHNDRGTAARYYHQAGWEHERAEMRCAHDPETGEPLCVVAKLDEQAGENKSSTNPDRFRGMKKFTGKHYASDDYSLEMERGRVATYDDEGGRSRYFHRADWSHEIAERLATEAPVRYCPKAAKSERSKGLDDFFWRKDKASPTGFVRVTEDEWEALGEEEKRVKEETGKRVSLRARGNIHVALKPLSLCEWLCRLLSPPPEYAPRRLAIPFSGSGSELCAAIISGCFEKIVAIDYIKDYCDIAEARAAFWAGQPVQLKLED